MRPLGLRPNYREGTQLQPSTENWIKGLQERGPTYQGKTQIPQQPLPPIRKLSQASYPSEGRQNGNQNYRKLTNQTDHLDHSLSNSYEPWYVGPHKMDGWCWRVLTKCGLLEKEMANHPMNSKKSKEMWHWKMNSLGQQVTNMLLEWRNSSRKNEEVEPK